MNVLAGKRLRYVILNDTDEGAQDAVTEVGFKGTLPGVGIGVGYCNGLDQNEDDDGNPIRKFGPYIERSDTGEQYGEDTPDPNGPGFDANLRDQFEHWRKQLCTHVEIDNPDSLPLYANVRSWELAEKEYGFRLVAKNPFLKSEDDGNNGASLVARPSCDAIIIENGAGNVAQNHAMRVAAGKPDLPMRFLFHGNQRAEAEKRAAEAKGYNDVGVTYSSNGEYGSSEDLALPQVRALMPDINFVPAPVQPAAPLTLGGRVARAMARRGYCFQPPGEPTITAIIGADLDGRPNGNPPDKFNDLRLIFWRDKSGAVVRERVWVCTTDPGKQYVEDRINPGGAAQIKPGQYPVWVRGFYHGNASLCQWAGDITVQRDDNENFMRDPDDPLDTGGFGVHWHGPTGHETASERVGGLSAGCIVALTMPEQRQFMGEVETDSRYLANPQFAFTGTILTAEEVAAEGGSIAPSAPQTQDAHALLTPEIRERITVLAASSVIASYAWGGRGHAPIGYIKGMAATFALVYLKLKAGESSALAMTAPIGNAATDALAHYGVTAGDRVSVLKQVFALAAGLGMRESSGNCFEGRDTSADNTSSDTAEAGLFQQSYNSFVASAELSKLMAAYIANPKWGYLSIFREGVSGGLTADYGSGQGAAFQHLCKISPSFAVEAAAIGLRVIRKHWGPINRLEAEMRPEAIAMFGQVQSLVDGIVVPVDPLPIDGEVLDPLDPGPIVVMPDHPLWIDLILNLLERQMTNAGQRPDLAKLFAEFRAFTRNPIVQRLLNGGAATLDELLSLPPALRAALIEGDTPALSAAASEAQPQPQPVPVAPATSTSVNVGTGILGVLGAAVTWFLGGMGDTSAVLTGATAIAAAATGLPAPTLNFIFSLIQKGAGLLAPNKTA